MFARKLTATLSAIAASASFAAWEEVPLPPKEDGFIYWMDFPRPDLGFACISDPDDPRPFLTYRDGQWYDGAFALNALAKDSSFLPNGYGWVVGESTRLYPCIYTYRLRAGLNQLEPIPNPYSNPPGAEGGSPRVSFPAEEDGWLILRSPNELLRYEDGYWRSLGNPLPEELGGALDICFPTTDEGWVAGWNGFAHYKNGTWEFVAGPRVWRLDFTAPDDGWAISYDGPNIYHYDGASWSVSYSAPGYTASGVNFSNPDNGWATYWLRSGREPVVIKYDNGSWHKVIPPNRYGCGTPVTLSTEVAWFHGYSSASEPLLTTWRWTTAPNVAPASLGRIKAMFAEEEVDDEEGINVPAKSGRATD